MMAEAKKNDQIEKLVELKVHEALAEKRGHLRGDLQPKEEPITSNAKDAKENASKQPTVEYSHFQRKNLEGGSKKHSGRAAGDSSNSGQRPLIPRTEQSTEKTGKTVFVEEKDPKKRHEASWGALQRIEDRREYFRNLSRYYGLNMSSRENSPANLLGKRMDFVELCSRCGNEDHHANQCRLYEKDKGGKWTLRSALDPSDYLDYLVGKVNKDRIQMIRHIEKICDTAKETEYLASAKERQALSKYLLDTKEQSRARPKEEDSTRVREKGKCEKPLTSPSGGEGSWKTQPRKSEYKRPGDTESEEEGEDHEDEAFRPEMLKQIPTLEEMREMQTIPQGAIDDFLVHSEHEDQLLVPKPKLQIEALAVLARAVKIANIRGLKDWSPMDILVNRMAFIVEAQDFMTRQLRVDTGDTDKTQESSQTARNQRDLKKLFHIPAKAKLEGLLLRYRTRTWRLKEPGLLPRSSELWVPEEVKRIIKKETKGFLDPPLGDDAVIIDKDIAAVFLQKQLLQEVAHLDQIWQVDNPGDFIMPDPNADDDDPEASTALESLLCGALTGVHDYVSKVKAAKEFLKLAAYEPQIMMRLLAAIQEKARKVDDILDLHRVSRVYNTVRATAKRAMVNFILRERLLSDESCIRDDDAVGLKKNSCEEAEDSIDVKLRAFDNMAQVPAHKPEKTTTKIKLEEKATPPSKALTITQFSSITKKPSPPDAKTLTAPAPRQWGSSRTSQIAESFKSSPYAATTASRAPPSRPPVTKPVIKYADPIEDYFEDDAIDVDADDDDEQFSEDVFQRSLLNKLTK